jgi:hypothetical protein
MLVEVEFIFFLVYIMSKKALAQPLDESEILLDDNASDCGTQQTDDNEIQAPIEKRVRGRPPVPKPAPVYKPRTQPAVKKERTEAQKEATRKMLEARDKNRAARPSVTAVKQDLKALREQQIEELKAQAVKEYQDSLVKKAISIKKKQIKKQVELEEISDDETPIEDIRKIVKKMPAKQSNPVPRSLPTPMKPAISFI